MENFKYLPGRTPSDKVLHYETFNFAKNKKNEGYLRELTSMAYIFFLIKRNLVVFLKVKLYQINKYLQSSISQLL